jgi:hypothetical protein
MQPGQVEFPESSKTNQIDLNVTIGSHSKKIDKLSWEQKNVLRLDTLLSLTVLQQHQH